MTSPAAPATPAQGAGPPVPRWLNAMLRAWPVMAAFAAFAIGFVDLRADTVRTVEHIGDENAHPKRGERIVRLEERLAGIQGTLTRIERTLERIVPR